MKFGLAEKAASFGRRAETYALLTVIAADTEAEAGGLADRIVAGADRGAITNVIASASMDFVPGIRSFGERVMPRLSHAGVA